MITKTQIIGAINKIRDPFGERPSKEERNSRLQVEAALHQVRALQEALNAGADVQRPLEQAQEHLAEVHSRLPRGHRVLFVALCVWVVVTWGTFVISYLHIRPILFKLWKAPTHSYLQEFRSWSAYVWQITDAIVTSPLGVAGIPIALLISTWFAQRRLPRWQARAIIRTVGVVTVLVFFVVIVSLFGLLTFVPFP
jgi:hypothetical protein